MLENFQNFCMHTWEQATAYYVRTAYSRGKFGTAVYISLDNKKLFKSLLLGTTKQNENHIKSNTKYLPSSIPPTPCSLQLHYGYTDATNIH
jgi:uncharacterized protein (UPF0303 family)